MRDPSLAADNSSSLDVVLDALDRAPGFDIVVLLQPTSPLRRADDIDSAIRLCLEKEAPACVSVCEVEKSPYWMYTRDSEARLYPLLSMPSRATRRQDLPRVHVLNGAIYVSRVDILRRERAFVVEGTVGYEMPKDRSVDIDTELDLLFAEYLLSGNLQ